jgi:hypothetical protein
LKKSDIIRKKILPSHWASWMEQGLDIRAGMKYCNMVWYCRVLFGDCQLFLSSLNCPFDIILNLKVLIRLVWNAFEFTKSFSLLELHALFYLHFHPFFPTGLQDSRILKNPLKSGKCGCLPLFKRVAIQIRETCWPVGGGELQWQFWKLLANSKGSGGKWLRFFY